MAQSHLQLLSNCTDDQLRRICERRKVPVPQLGKEGPEGRMRLLKTMVFHLEDNKRLTDTLADLPGPQLQALKRLVEEGVEPPEAIRAELADQGLLFATAEAAPRGGRSRNPWAVSTGAPWAFRAARGAARREAPPYAFALALTSVLLRCVGGIRVLKGGLPAKKELGQLLQRNALLKEERDATLAFALLHRLGLLWSREGRVDTLLPAVLAQAPRWVAERAFAKLLEDDLKLWSLPPSEDRLFLMRHLLERRGQVLAVQPFLAFLRTLHPLDLERTRGAFLPFLSRMGLLAMDEAGEHLALTSHGEALAQEYLLRDRRSTEAHWAPLGQPQPLVLQPTMEVLTPALQSPHRLLLLAQMAEVETLDTMVGFRIRQDTLVRALDAGVTLEELRGRLGGPEAAFPQPLAQLLDDLSRRLGEVEVRQGVRLVNARTPELAEELRLRPELASLALKPLSDTILEANGPGNAFAMLKQAGFLPKPGRFLPVSVDGDESLYLWALACLAFVAEKGMSHHLEPVHHMIEGTLARVQSEDPLLYQEVLRRVPMLHVGGADQATEETQRILEYAASYNLMVELSYMPLAAHRAQLRRVTPQALEGEHLRAFCHLHQEEMSFRLSRILGARLLNEKGWNPVQGG